MLVLDTDHLTEFQKGTSPEAHFLKQRLADSAKRKDGSPEHQPRRTWAT